MCHGDLFLSRTTLAGQDEAVAGGKIKNVLWHKNLFPMRNSCHYCLRFWGAVSNNFVRQEIHVQIRSSIEILASDDSGREVYLAVSVFTG